LKQTTDLMTAIPQDWSREDFLALALHFAANADLAISDTEKDYMRRICGEAHCRKAADYDDNHSDYEVIQTIFKLKEQFFPGEQGSEELKGHLTALFKSDDNYSHLEHNMMHGLERFLR
jgi:hypothetical protein